MFKSTDRSLLAVVGALVLSACGTQLQRAEEVPVVDSAFHRYLYSGYITLSQSEFQEGDYLDADAFAERAMRAARGEVVLPEAIEARRLPESRAGSLIQARRQLIVVLEAGARDGQPELAARLQTAFDCWMQEQEETLESVDIAVCRNGFETRLVALETAQQRAEATKKPVGNVPLPPQKLSPSAENRKAAASYSSPAPTADGLPGTYIIFFGLDDTRLDESAKEILTEVVRAAKEAEDLTVVAAGHSDSSGPSDYNHELAQNRADMVARFLVESGIERLRIRSESFGESKPLVPGSDESLQPQNRRVEIHFLREFEPPEDAPEVYVF